MVVKFSSSCLKPIKSVFNNSRIAMSVSRTRGVIFDVEAHHVVEPRIVEAAYGYVDGDGVYLPETAVCQRYDPGLPSSLGALATHHILDHELAGMPSSDTFALPDDVGFVIGHNVSFDLMAAGSPPEIRSIDTLVLARKAWPELDSHTQSALFYHLHGESFDSLAKARELLRGAHSAGTDIKVCAEILRALIEHFDEDIQDMPQIVSSRDDLPLLERLHLLSLAASVPLQMTFGQHKGLDAHRVPHDYKRWYLNLATRDPLVAIAMTAGAGSEKDRELYLLAQAVFGEGSVPEAQVDVDRPRQPGAFSFSR
ncbi:3'-5' exonuclease [Achromobacter denitrificans]|jgi:exodeoxyribonuclease X